ncbi:MAG TPA: 23S rRNA (pseudouridine(1915)-N(3))-methyltransferase RlmH [Elainellaceae cyanobacterium]
MVYAFPKVRVIAVGKLKKSWLREGIAIYLKRSPEIEILEIKDSDKEKEGEKILSFMKGDETLVVLSEDGKLISSVDFANLLTRYASNNVVFAIGGPDGISQTLKDRASLLLSLSPMTFPHEIARILLIEQLYRAKTILQGGNYHK